MDSGSLRIGILIVGAMVIAGIYLWGSWTERRTRRKARVEPAVGVLSDEDFEVIPMLTERAVSKKGDEPPAIVHAPVSGEPPKKMILTFGVMAPQGGAFSGGEMAQVLRKAGMVYGAMNIFHAPADYERPDGPELFSLANILEPGTLEPERLRTLTTPGILLFAQLPGAVRGTEILDHMLATGRFLARELRGELCDERRQPMTDGKADELRSRILSEIGDSVRKPDFG